VPVTERRRKPMPSGVGIKGDGEPSGEC